MCSAEGATAPEIAGLLASGSFACIQLIYALTQIFHLATSAADVAVTHLPHLTSATHDQHTRQTHLRTHMHMHMHLYTHSYTLMHGHTHTHTYT